MKCDPRDVALKTFFLGPQAENAGWLAEQVRQTFESWFAWRRSLFPDDGRAISNDDQDTPEFLERRKAFASALQQLLSRFEAEIPKFSPRYLGHMFSESSLPALLGHIVTLLHNPNNISGESAPVGVKIEDEAISALLQMMGFDQALGSGHFTSGGTIANFEALVRARARMSQWLALGCWMRDSGYNHRSLFEAAHLGWGVYDKIQPRPDTTRWDLLKENPFETARLIERIFGEPWLGPVVLVPENKHYSWPKAVSLLGLGQEAFWPIELDSQGKLSVRHLTRLLERAERDNRPVLAVVSVAGTTELGQIDPIYEVNRVLENWRARDGIDIWHHVDAAYGGFFRTMLGQSESPLSTESRENLAAIAEATSVTLDPHKLGYVPYSSGAILVRDRRDYFLAPMGAPYIQFDEQRDRGPFTLEGSRSAAGAAATWMTAQSIGFGTEGYGRILARTIQNKRALEDKLRRSGLPIRIAPQGETNILCFTIGREAETVSKTNQRAEALFHALSSGDGTGPFHVSKTSLKWSSYGAYLSEFTGSWRAKIDAPELFLVRMCLMNPFIGSKETQIDFLDAFVARLKEIEGSLP